jgi:hypothetical protein
MAAFLAWRKEVKESERLRTTLAAHGGEAHQGMIFVDEAPSFLTQLCKGHTSIQAKKLAVPYMGKWMRLSNVSISDIEEYGSGHRIAGSSADGVLVPMYFEEPWSERILILRRGSKIAIIGKIAWIDEGYVRLDECQILDSRPDPT